MIIHVLLPISISDTLSRNWRIMITSARSRDDHESDNHYNTRLSVNNVYCSCYELTTLMRQCCWHTKACTKWPPIFRYFKFVYQIKITYRWVSNVPSWLRTDSKSLAEQMLTKYSTFNRGALQQLVTYLYDSPFIFILSKRGRYRFFYWKRKWLMTYFL